MTDEPMFTLRREDPRTWTLALQDHSIQLTLVHDAGDGSPAVLAFHAGVLLYGTPLVHFPWTAEEIKALLASDLFAELVDTAAGALMLAHSGAMSWDEIHEAARCDVEAQEAQEAPVVPQPAPAPQTPAQEAQRVQDAVHPLDLLLFYALAEAPARRGTNKHPHEAARA